MCICCRKGREMITGGETQAKAVAKEYFDAVCDKDLVTAGKIFDVMIAAEAHEFRAWRRACYEYYRGYKAGGKIRLW
jgi:hypothetical protein